MGGINLPDILANHRKWLERDPQGIHANLEGANLARANLEGANLAWANLEGANLAWATLEGANLEGATLEGANLAWATLEGANLEGATLEGANLRGAHLEGANLEGATLDGGTILDTGESWKVYLSETLPQLFHCSERGLDAIAAWGNHDWSACPMHVLFHINNEQAAPALLRPRVRQFIQLFDANLIPQPDPAILEEKNSG